MAEEAIEGRLSPLAPESRPLEQCVGRTLRQDVFAERDNPPFDRICMDGIAINSAALTQGQRRFAIEATQPAGSPAITLSSSKRAIEVMTGAVLPQGADCVIPLEDYDLSDGVVSLKPDATGEPYANVQRRGSESEPGVPMLRAGMRLGAAEIAVAASAGLARLSVSRQPRMVVISTGDELVEPGQPILEHQIRRSNSYAVVASLRAHGFEQVTDDHIPDNEELLRERLSQHLAEQDVLILSGGMSKGKLDLVPEVLKELQVEEIFYRIAQRPGAPMWFGIGAGGRAVFGLPGNPVSTLMCLIRYVVPGIAAAMGTRHGHEPMIELASPVKPGRSVAWFVPVCVQSDARGRTTAMVKQPKGSGDFLSLAGTDGFVELPPRADAFPAGFVARLYRW